MKYGSFFFILLIYLSFNGCSRNDSNINSSDDQRFRRIGVLVDSNYDGFASLKNPDAKILMYSDVSDLVIALQSNKVDAIYYEYVSLRDLFHAYNSIEILTPTAFSVPIGAGFSKTNNQLRKRFNDFLKEIRSNGVYDDMEDRWFIKGESEVPEIKSSGKNGKLRVGLISDLGQPFGFVKNGILTGFNVELSKRFASYLGKEFIPLTNGLYSQIASLHAGKVDIAVCSMAISEDAKNQIDFSDPYFESEASLIVKNKKLSGDIIREDKSFMYSIYQSIYDNLIFEDRYKLILAGLSTTIRISLLSALLGTIVAALICFIRMSKRKTFLFLGKIFIALLRGTPVLVILMMVYYVVFDKADVDAVLVSVIAFALNFGANVSEIFRTSIESIPSGQKEAGIAGGFTHVQTFLYIITPQALPKIIPVYKGEFISLIKNTSIVGYIAVLDLTKASSIIQSRTFDAFFPLILAAVIYLLISWLLTVLLSKVEISFDPKRKRFVKRVGIK